MVQAWAGNCAPKFPPGWSAEMNRPRLLVTRAEPDASDTARLIAELGGEAVLLTTRREVAIVEPAPVRPDLLIATSPRAFRLGEAIPADWFGLPCLVVGGVTGEAARQAGFSDIRMAGGEAASLAPLLAPFAGKHAIYLAGEPRRPELESDARAAGLILGLWRRYRMEEGASPEEVEAKLAGRIDAVLHFSRESAASLARAVAASAHRARLWRAGQACLSPAVAGSLREAMGPLPFEPRLALAPERNAASLVRTALALARQGDGAQFD